MLANALLPNAVAWVVGVIQVHQRLSQDGGVCQLNIHHLLCCGSPEVLVRQGLRADNVERLAIYGFIGQYLVACRVNLPEFCAA